MEIIYLYMYVSFKLISYTRYQNMYKNIIHTCLYKIHTYTHTDIFKNYFPYIFIHGCNKKIILN